MKLTPTDLALADSICLRDRTEHKSILEKPPFLAQLWIVQNYQYLTQAPMNGHSHIQWKFAMARMQAANLAATEISEQGEPIRRAIRKIAEQQLDRYFELVEAELNDRRKLYAEGAKIPE